MTVKHILLPTASTFRTSRETKHAKSLTNTSAEGNDYKSEMGFTKYNHCVLSHYYRLFDVELLDSCIRQNE